MQSQVEQAVANTVVVEKEKEKVVDRCFEAEEKLALEEIRKKKRKQKTIENRSATK